MKKKKVAGRDIPKMRNRLGVANIIFIAFSIIIYILTFFYCSIESVIDHIGYLVCFSWILAFPRFPAATEIIYIFICPYSMRTYLWVGSQNLLTIILISIGWQCKTHINLAAYLILLVGMNIKGFPWIARLVIGKPPSLST